MVQYETLNDNDGYFGGGGVVYIDVSPVYTEYFQV